MQETITATLGLDTTAFSEGVAKAGTSAKQLENSIESSTGAVGNLASKIPVAGAAVSAAFLLMYNKAKNLADTLLRLETITGMSTDKLQYLTNAAEVNGSSTEAMGTALEFFNKQVANQNAAFRELGVSLVDINGKQKTTNEIYDEVTNALAETTDAHLKARVSIDLFGKSSQELIPILSAGSAELSNMGGTFLTVSRENLKAIDDFEDSLVAMGKLGVSAFSEVLGAVLRFPSAITEASKVTAELATSWLNLPFDWWVSKEGEKTDATKKTTEALMEQELSQRRSLDHARALVEVMNRSKFFDKSDTELQDELNAKKSKWSEMENADQEDKKAFLNSVRELNDEIEKRARKAELDKKQALDDSIKSAQKELQLQKDIQETREKISKLKSESTLKPESIKILNDKLSKLENELGSKQFYAKQEEAIKSGKVTSADVMTYEQHKFITEKSQQVVYNLDPQTGQLVGKLKPTDVDITAERSKFNEQQNQALYLEKELVEAQKLGNRDLLAELKRSNEFLQRLLTIQ
jgi:hypothetical protein